MHVKLSLYICQSYLHIDIRRCGVSANETTLHSHNNL